MMKYKTKKETPYFFPYLYQILTDFITFSRAHCLDNWPNNMVADDALTVGSDMPDHWLLAKPRRSATALKVRVEQRLIALSKYSVIAMNPTKASKEI